MNGFTARYSGVCAKTGATINPGDLVARDGDGGYVLVEHVEYVPPEQPAVKLFDSYDEADAAIVRTESDRGKKLREEAADCIERERESFERCDTDGFLSQWCLTIRAQELEREAELADAGYQVAQKVLVEVDSGRIVATSVRPMNSRFHYGTDYKWRAQRSSGAVEWVTDYARESGYAKLGLAVKWIVGPGAMFSRRPGDMRPEPRGLGGMASYQGKYAHLDAKAMGLPI